MANPIEYATYVIDLTNAMIEHPQGLNKEQFHRVGLINHRTVEFVTGYLQNECLSAPALLQYLTYTQEPLRAILGNCKRMLSGQCGAMDADYVEAIQEIFDCVRAMVDDIQQLCHDLKEFMATIGMEH
jgi:hypothetical protein